MKLDNDTSGIEEAQADLTAMKNHKPFTSYWAAKIDGQWHIYNAIRGITGDLRKCETACPFILHGQEAGKAYAIKALQKAFKENL